ncbi:MAG: hypothetical protein QOD42_561 [Sphingomonadales bacterium]|jgi:hypothetical protein|nr:hypothetical protein [Sphingomonadales bacterium]
MIRWLVSLLLTVGLGAAPTEGTRPGVMATYESGAGVARVMVMIWPTTAGGSAAASARAMAG